MFGLARDIALDPDPCNPVLVVRVVAVTGLVPRMDQNGWCTSRLALADQEYNVPEKKQN